MLSHLFVSLSELAEEPYVGSEYDLCSIRQAAQYVGPQGRVVGLDLKAEMIAFARSLPPSSDVAIEWIEGDAVQLPFPDATFDIVFCQGGLQFIHDRHAALHEMFRFFPRFLSLSTSLPAAAPSSHKHPSLLKKWGNRASRPMKGL